MDRGDLKIVLCQCDILWESPQENCSRLSAMLEEYLQDKDADLMVLPEFFSMGFTMSADAVLSEEGMTLRWMHSAAARYGVAIVGSIPTMVQGKIHNRCYFVAPDGTENYYDKRHLFRMGDENSHYTRGDEITIVEYKGVKFALNICYDIRFPVWSRNKGNKYDVLLNIANFPEVRIKAIEPLARARSIENLAYTIFVNRDGKDPLCIYCPSSQMYDYKGDDIAQEKFITDSDGCRTQVICCNIDIEGLQEFRDKFPAWMDADTFNLIR